MSDKVKIKIKFNKPKNPIIDSGAKVPNTISVGGKTFTYNKIYTVEETFAERYADVFKIINDKQN